MVCKCLDYDQSCIRYGHFTPRSQITLKIVWSRPWKLSPNKRQLHNINSNKYQSSGATTAPRPKLSDFATGNSLITSLYFEMANYFSTQSIITLWKRKILGFLPNFAILFLFSKSSFWYGFYLKNENEKFLFYLKYKENMCGSWFASQFTPPIPPPTNQPNAEIWHINVSVPKTKRWIIQIKNFHFCYQKNKTKQNIIPFFLNVRK